MRQSPLWQDGMMLAKTRIAARARERRSKESDFARHEAGRFYAA
jgi:hypothetical protein